MGEVARAVLAGGGHVTGVIPRALLELGVGEKAVTELVVTDGLRDRKAIMDERGDAFVALPGGLGTLEELLEVWSARVLGLHDKPVVVLDTDGLYAPLAAQVALMVERGFVRRAAADALQWATSVEQALDLVEEGIAHPVRIVPTPSEELEGEP